MRYMSRLFSRSIHRLLWRWYLYRYRSSFDTLRLERAIGVAGGVIAKRATLDYFVESETNRSGNGRPYMYSVELGLKPQCNCPDHLLRGTVLCKHVIAATATGMWG